MKPRGDAFLEHPVILWELQRFGSGQVGVLSSDSYMCDNQNTDCRTNDIKASSLGLKGKDAC